MIEVSCKVSRLREIKNYLRDKTEKVDVALRIIILLKLSTAGSDNSVITLKLEKTLQQRFEEALNATQGDP